ncbi:unnamed protein product [Camellia sinensis]
MALLDDIFSAKPSPSYPVLTQTTLRPLWTDVTPDKMRELVQLTFYKPPKILPSCVLTDFIRVPGLANVDFADMRAIMENAGSSLIGIGTATGKTRARDAALNAIQSPLLDIGIERATGIVWNITGGSNLTLYEDDAVKNLVTKLHCKS